MWRGLGCADITVTVVFLVAAIVVSAFDLRKTEHLCLMWASVVPRPALVRVFLTISLEVYFALWQLPVYCDCVLDDFVTQRCTSRTESLKV